jgi:hypothetical protein
MATCLMLLLIYYFDFLRAEWGLFHGLGPHHALDGWGERPPNSEDIAAHCRGLDRTVLAMPPPDNKEENGLMRNYLRKRRGISEM